MAYTIEFDEGTCIATIEVTGPVDFAELLRSREEMAEICSTKECAKVLVNALGMSDFVSSLKTWEFASDMWDFFPPNTKFALVHDNAHAEQFSFLSLVANNRGFRMIETESVQYAVNWLDN